MRKFCNGTYRVSVTDIASGNSSIKGTQYIELTFTNGFRFHTERIYVSGNGIKYLGMIYKKAGLILGRCSMEDIINKSLGIEVVSGSYGFKTYGKLGTVYSYDELMNAPEEYCRVEPSVYDYGDDDYIEDESASMADVFGVDVSDVANDLGMNCSDVTDSDIREYCGY